MKKKELQDIKVKNVSELEKFIKTKKEDLLNIQLKVKIGGEKNLKKARNLRKDIAQALTVLGEKMIIESEKRTEKKEEIK